MNKEARKKLAVKITLQLLEEIKDVRINSTTQKEMAKELDVDTGTVSRYESNFIDLTVEKFVEMCIILKMDPAAVFSRTFYEQKSKNS